MGKFILATKKPQIPSSIPSKTQKIGGVSNAFASAEQMKQAQAGLDAINPAQQKTCPTCGKPL